MMQRIFICIVNPLLIINERCIKSQEDLHTYLLCCCFSLVSSFWLHPSGPEMLNFDSLKLFRMEIGRQM